MNNKTGKTSKNTSIYKAKTSNYKTYSFTLVCDVFADSASCDREWVGSTLIDNVTATSLVNAYDQVNDIVKTINSANTGDLIYRISSIKVIA